MEKYLIDYYDAIHQYFIKNVANREDANDLTQEVWLKILKNRSHSSPINNVKSWMFTVARNTLIDFYRKHNQTKSLSDWDSIFEQLSDTDNAYLQTKLLTCLGLYIQDLPSDVKKILVASDLKGVSQKNLAEQLEIPYPTLRAKLQRGRKKIKKMFERDCYLALGKRGGVLDCRCKC